MDAHEIDQLEQQLYEDLGYLAEQLNSDGPLPLQNIRLAAATVCRKWLIDRKLVQLFNAQGCALTLPALDTTSHVNIIESDGDFNFYTAGGVSIDGRPINSIYAASGPRPKNGENRLPVPSFVDLSVSKFMSRQCTFIEGKWITNEDILRYVANKSGGIHFDRSRKKDVDHAIDRASAALWVGDLQPDPWPDGLEVFLQVPKPTIQNWNCTHIEMLSIGQSFVHMRANGIPLFHFDGKSKSRENILEKIINWATKGKGRWGP